MPFVYDIMAGVNYATSAAGNTEDAFLAIRQATRGVDVTGVYAGGKASAATTISGIAVRIKRWTTVGTGGTALTPAPRRIGTTAATTAADKQTALTPGTVSGAYQGGFVFGKAGPGGWVARDSDSAIHLEAGSADELALYSATAEAAALNFECNCEIAE
jgi:hypothetical protein